MIIDFGIGKTVPIVQYLLLWNGMEMNWAPISVRFFPSLWKNILSVLLLSSLLFLSSIWRKDQKSQVSEEQKKKKESAKGIVENVLKLTLSFLFQANINSRLFSSEYHTVSLEFFGLCLRPLRLAEDGNKSFYRTSRNAMANNQQKLVGTLTQMRLKIENANLYLLAFILSHVLA